jgi:hypothetical protein
MNNVSSGPTFSNLQKNPNGTTTVARPGSSAVYRPQVRRKTFSMKRETEAEKFLDEYLRKRYTHLKE